MKFGKNATNFDSPHAESCPNGRRNAEPPKLLALFPNCMHCRLNWPELGVYWTLGNRHLFDDATATGLNSNHVDRVLIPSLTYQLPFDKELGQVVRKRGANRVRLVIFSSN